jgi:hypothetical protein
VVVRPRYIPIVFLLAGMLGRPAQAALILSGATSLYIPTSVRSAGMAGASLAAFWGDEPDYWANPALLGYERGLHYQYSYRQLVPSLANDIFIKNERIDVGAYGVGLGFSGLPEHRLGRTLLDFGSSEGQSDHSFEAVHSWALGVNLVEVGENALQLVTRRAPSIFRHAEISLGYSTKKVRVHLAPAGSFAAGDDGTAEAHDRGLVVRLTPYNSLEGTSEAGASPPLRRLRLDLGYGRSIQNSPDARVTFGGSATQQPIARVTGQAFAAHISVGLFSGLREGLKSEGLGWLAHVIGPCLTSGLEWDRRHESVDGEESRAMDAFGLEIGLANILTLRAGHVHEPDFEVDGWSRGWGLGLRFGDVAGFRFDRAEVPQASDLPKVKPKGFTAFLDGVALVRALRHSEPSGR